LWLKCKEDIRVRHTTKEGIYSYVQNNSSVFKKMSKAQNPKNNFYFNTQKCIGNTAHSIQDQNIKKNL